MKSVCMFVSVCPEDACWLQLFLSEVDRLNLPFVVLLDRWGFMDDPGPLVKHWLCAGYSKRPYGSGEFNEQHKQIILDLAAAKGFDWAMAHDIDESYERNARKKIDAISELDADLVDIRWLNLWGDRDHVRVDSGFASGHRVKFYNLRSGEWVFDHPITNGAKLVGREGVTVKADLVCLHHGFMTKELRVMHKERWDRIYSTALRGDPNPYGAWKLVCDESIKPVLIRHEY